MIRHWRCWLVLVLLPASAIVGLRLYLASHFVVARVAAQLEELYGGTVSVGGAVIGAQHTVLTDVALFEQGDASQPWLRIDRLEADLSLADAVAGIAPSRLVLHGLTVTLRFDGEGRLLLNLPPKRANAISPLEKLPEIIVAGSTIRLVGPGTRQLVINDVALKLTPGSDRHTFQGEGRSPTCGDCTASGWIDCNQSQVSLTAKSAGDVAVTQDILEALPFVEAETWLEVQAEGATPVVATLRYDWKKPKRSYRVELQLKKATIRVAAIDLTATEVAGSVEIADAKVLLRNLHGRSSGGTLAVDGDLDFTQPGVCVDLTKLVVADAKVRQLPAQWSLPSQLEGELNGTSQLRIISHNGKVHAEGTGTGEVRQARLAGQVLADPILLELQNINQDAHLRMDLHLPTSELAVWASALGTQLPPETGGRAALDGALFLPLDTIDNPTTYRGQGRINLTGGRVAGLMLEPLAVGVKLIGQELQFDDFRAKLQAGGSCGIDAKVGIKAPFTYDVRLKPAEVDLKVLDQLQESWRPATRLTGRFAADVDARGTLRPFSLATAGNATLDDLQTNGITVPAAQLKWRSEGERVNADLQASELTLDKLPTSHVAASLQVSPGIAKYQVEGQAFCGDFGLEGELAASGQEASTWRHQNGRLWLHGLDFAHLSGLADPGRIAGTLDADLTLHQDGDSLWPTAKGRMVVNALGLKDQQPLVPEVLADVVLSRKELKVGNLTATLAQGNVSGKVVVDLKQPDRSWFQLDLSNAELTELVRPWPALAGFTQGTVDARLRGNLGRECSGSANVVVQRGKLLGIDVTEWRVPVSWTLWPEEGRGDVQVRDSNAQVAQGRVTANASALWQGGLRLNSQIQFTGVDLRQAFPGTKIGNGRANGRIDLNSEHLRSLDDLQGTLIATVQHTQALDYPVLRQVAPLLGMSTTKTFQNGEIRARLARGVVRVEKLALAEGPLQLYAEGNVTLQGNVHLDMTANTGKLGNLAAALGWRIPQTGTIAGELLSRTTTALSPQLVHVHVRGTVREPTVQIVPLPLLTEQALRFFAGM